MKRIFILALALILFGWGQVAVAAEGACEVPQGARSANDILVLAGLVIAPRRILQICLREDSASTRVGFNFVPREPTQLAESRCPSGYPIRCASKTYCCRAGYSCNTGCACRVGKARCSSGCCPFATPHTCSQAGKCFRTLSDAVAGGCPRASIEVCGVSR